MSKTNENITISVIIPFYNRLSLLFKTIESVLKQTYQNFEIVLIDDGSTDDLHQLMDFIKKDSRIVYHRQEHGGVSRARNLGISISTGSYIAFLDSDDLFMPEKLEKQLSFMLKNNYQVSHTSLERFNSRTGEAIEILNFGQNSGDLFPEILQSCRIAIPTLMIKKEILNSINEPFNPEYEVGEDICLLIDIAYKYLIGGIDEVLLRVSANEGSAAYNRDKQMQGLFNILSYIMSRSEYRHHISQIRKLVQEFNDQFSPYTPRENDVWQVDKNDIEKQRRDNAEYFSSIHFYPKVSIVIPVYNGANYMCEAIESALCQTYPNVEILVINDGSTDNGETERIALSYGNRIRYFCKENGGVASALNLGIEKMTGEYFSWLSHDDMYTCDKLKSQIEILSHLDDKTTIVTGGYTVMDAKRNYLYDVAPLQQYSADQLNQSVFSLLRGAIHGCSMLIHKSHFERVGVFDIALPTTQDYDLFFRMLRHQKIYYYSGLDVLSRSHEAQDSKKLLNMHVDECNNLWIGMMKALTDEEKCELDGSLFLFYYNIADFMKNVTSYDKAIAYAENCAIKQIPTVLINSSASTSNEQKLASTYLKSFTGLSYANLQHLEIGKAIQFSKAHKRIAFFMGDRNILGGLNRVVLQIAGGLCDYYDVYLITFDKQSSEGYSADPRIRQIVFPHTGDEVDYHNKLVKLLVLIDTDVYVGSHNCINSYLNMYEGLRECGIKTIAWNHEFYFLAYWNYRFNKCLQVKNKALAQADVALWLNSFSANAYALLQSNAAIMPNPVTISPQEYDDVSKRPRNIVAVSRFDDPRKGLAELLCTFAEVLKKCPDTKLNIVGPYDLEAEVPNKPNMTYKQLIKKLGLPNESLNFTDWVKDVERYYKEGCVHLMPSRYEGFGLTITEAAAYGIPSIIFEGSGLDDIITDGVDGFIVPQGDTSAMAKRVISLLTDKSRLKSMSDASRLLIQRYEMPKIIDRWRKLIEAVLSMKKDKLEKYLKQEFMFPVKDEKAFCKQVANEYENCITNLCSNQQGQCSITSMPDVVETENPYIAEVLAMQQSFSWRITKPLRWAKRIMVSLKRYGLHITLNKIKQKIKMKMHA